MPRPLLGLALAVALGGCSSAASTGLELPDATLPSDAGVEVPDSGAGDASPDAAVPDAGPSLGVIQFRTKHNLTTDACLARGDCAMTFEEPTASLGPWLGRLRATSSQAVLHFDRAIPWTAFSRDPPPDATFVSWYDSRIDDDLRDYLDQFVDHFGAFDDRYLAVSILDGTRDRLVPERRPDGSSARLTNTCTVLTATAAVTFVPGEAPVVVEAAYRRFVRYLAAKLHPTRLAILVEADLYRALCPSAWPSMVALYRALHDELRVELGPDVKLFATLTLPHLLGYDHDQCNPFLFSLCGGPEPAEPPMPDAARCFPIDRAPIDALDEGGRLDVLALSFYPDGLLMNPPGVPADEVVAYAASSTISGTCFARAKLSPFADPLAAIDRLGWTKPIAIAETSARSCETYQWWVTPNRTLAVTLGGSAARQAYWLGRLVELARAGRFLFVNQAFLEGYEPLGLWLPAEEAMAPGIYDLLNTWPCSGLLDARGQPTPGVREAWPL